MKKSIYDSPSSDLTTNGESAVPEKERPKLGLVAFFLSPMVTISICIFLVFLFEVIIEKRNLVPTESLTSTFSDIFLPGVALLYIYLFVFGLFTHWLLGKYRRRKVYLYSLSGIFWLTPIMLLFGVRDDLLLGFIAFLISGAIGALCFTLFWVIGVYLPSKLPSNKALQSDAAKPRR